MTSLSNIFSSPIDTFTALIACGGGGLVIDKVNFTCHFFPLRHKLRAAPQLRGWMLVVGGGTESIFPLAAAFIKSERSY